MVEQRNETLAGEIMQDVDPVESAILDAAASCVVDLGADRITIAEIARRANVSRPTIYRRWSSTQDILMSLLTREILRVTRKAPWQGDDRAALVARAVNAAELVARNPIFEELLLASPQLLLTYTFQRLGASQRALIDIMAGALTFGQEDGSVRAGDPRQLAAMVLLTVQSAIQSARLVEPILDADALRTELTHLLNGYLKP